MFTEKEKVSYEYDVKLESSKIIPTILSAKASVELSKEVSKELELDTPESETAKAMLKDEEKQE